MNIYKTICAVAMISILSCLPDSAEAGNFSYTTCDALGDIGGKTVNARQAGHSLSDILNIAEYILSDSDDPRLLTLATGVVVAVYGDRSLLTYNQGYSAAFSACYE